MPRYSEDAIRAADGPTLTCMAWELGLAPPCTIQEDIPLYDHPRFILDQSYGQRATRNDLRPQWRPHEDIAQADAVFRKLRKQGWHTRLVTHSPDGGLVEATRVEHAPLWCLWGADRILQGDSVEAIALLRCAVLAANTGGA